jgi:anti-anti-sigma regulatory factor
MIRIETDQTDTRLTLRVAGRLCGANVEALAECWSLARSRGAAGRARSRQFVDLSDITSIDQAGWRLLRRMHNDGVEVSGKGLATQTILDELTYKEEKES